jgi:hypothetical protein
MVMAIFMAKAAVLCPKNADPTQKLVEVQDAL